jgi:hypothetical protein
MLFVTVAASTVCNDVYAVLNQDLATKVNALIEQGSLTPEMLKMLTPLGKVQFDSITAAPDQASLDAVAKAWRVAAAGGGTPSGSRAVYKRGDTQEGVYQMEARAIVQALGGAVPPFPAFGVVDALPSTCPTITLVVSTPRKARTARVVPYTGLTPAGARATLQAPVMSIKFGVDGKIAAFLSANDLGTLKGLGAISKGEMEFGDPLTVVGDSDVRVLSVSDSFKAVGAPLTAVGFGEVSTADRPFLQAGNNTFDDVLFVLVIQHQ